MKIVWLDPSRENVNAGDEIIAEAIGESGLAGISDAQRLTTHRMLRPSELRELQRADLVVVGGTNILNSQLALQRQWPLPPWQIGLLKKKLIFLGVGWWQYQKPPSATTTRILQFTSHPAIPHSVRDKYTADRLHSMGLRVEMTGCPTMWTLEGTVNKGAPQQSEAVIATITDYHFRLDEDRAWIQELSNRFREVLIVGMGPGDQQAYLRLPRFHNVRWFGFGRPALAEAREHADWHVGTRLHAAIRWLQLGGSSVVIAVDNRATEISASTHLPVVSRASAPLAIEKLHTIGSGSISVPLSAISAWRTAWNDYVR